MRRPYIDWLRGVAVVIMIMVVMVMIMVVIMTIACGDLEQAGPSVGRTQKS